jgi:hypothetical protein
MARDSTLLRGKGIPRGALGLLWLAGALAGLVGCSEQVRPITGGTPGVLRAKDGGLAEVQVSIHQHEGGGWRRLGFADTRADGAFTLIAADATAPLELSPGEYRCTLESVGAPIPLPAPYTHPETTPLVVTWSATDQELTLDVPVSLYGR